MSVMFCRTPRQQAPLLRSHPTSRHIMPSLKTALFLASGAVLLPSLADASGFPERALVSAARQIARNATATGARFGSGVSGTAAETATASDRRGLAEVLTPEQYVENFDLCPYYAASAKCSLLTTSAACYADSNCTYTLDATDPQSTKYPCSAATSAVLYDLINYHGDDFSYVINKCGTLTGESDCDADERCEWNDSDDTCGISIDMLFGDISASILRGHPHVLRKYAIEQTCATIETEALCGVGDTADKCEWLEASSGDEAGCFATPAYAAQQSSCECDAVKTDVPSVDYSNVVCATPSVEFISWNDEVTRDDAWACPALIGGQVCGSKSSVDTCEAESAYSCAVGSGECVLDVHKYANMGWSLDKATEPSWQKRNDTATACDTYDSSRSSCEAQSDCIYNDDDETCDVSGFFVASLLDEYCPTQTQDLTGEEYVEKFDLCPYYAASAKCSLLTTSAACYADSDCEYDLDATDPQSTKYPCVPAGDISSEFTDMLAIYHTSDLLIMGAFCEKTYAFEEISCDADERCEWNDSDDTCGISADAIASIGRGHSHLLRAYAIVQTCATIETEALCGVGDTADKCEWLEASSGDEAGCFATPAYAAQQSSCECDAVKTDVPSVDYSNVVCATPSVEFVDVYSGARTFEGGVLLGGALTLAACVLALA